MRIMAKEVKHQSLTKYYTYTPNQGLEGTKYSLQNLDLVEVLGKETFRLSRVHFIQVHICDEYSVRYPESLPLCMYLPRLLHAQPTRSTIYILYWFRFGTLHKQIFSSSPLITSPGTLNLWCSLDDDNLFYAIWKCVVIFDRPSTYIADLRKFMVKSCYPKFMASSGRLLMWMPSIMI